MRNTLPHDINSLFDEYQKEINLLTNELDFQENETNHYKQLLADANKKIIALCLLHKQELFELDQK